MSWGVALRNAVGLGLGGVPSLLNAPPYASLAFNFLSGQLDPRITFTRASTGTYVNSSGVLTSAAINTPRFDYDPVTLAPKGLLIEEQRTNLAVQSNAFTTTWLASDVTLTSGATVSPDGTANAWLLADTAANAFHNITQPIAWTAAAYTFSVYAKFNTHRWISARIGAAGNQFFGSWDLQNGVVGSATAGATVQMQNAGNGWYRLTLTATLSTAGNANLLIQLTNANSTSLVSYTGTATGSWIYVAQLEAGAFATSVIPTTTAAATRAADVASVTGANFSDWYNQVEGTTYVEASTLPSVTAAALTHAISDGTFNQSIYGNFNAGNLYIGANVLNSGVNQASGIGSFSITASTNTTKDAFAYKQNNFGESCNGATPKTDSTGTVPTVDRLYIGTNWAGAGNFLNGHIRSFSYYPKRLSNTALPALTRLPLWTPSQISTALWLDAADASTIVLNGSTVSQWGDKSGNGRNAVQTVAASQPSANVASLNGKNVITFSNDFLTSSVNIDRSVIPNLGVFIVFKSPTGAGNYALFGNDDGAFDRFALTLFSDVPAFQWGISNGNGVTPFTPTGTPDANPHILSAFLASGVTNGSYVGLDGKDFTVMTEVNFSTSETSTAIGAIDTTGARALTGDIAEFVLVNGAVDTSIRQKIEGYLAWKWGLQANLPVGHPYKNSPPTV